MDYKPSNRDRKADRKPAMQVNGQAFKRLLIDRAAKVAKTAKHGDLRDRLGPDGYTPTVRGWKNA